MKLSIVIPAFNEANTIAEVLRRVVEVDVEDLEKDIIVVDDGSTDGTRELLQSFERHHTDLSRQEQWQGGGDPHRLGLCHGGLCHRAGCRPGV